MARFVWCHFTRECAGRASSRVKVIINHGWISIGSSLAGFFLLRCGPRLAFGLDMMSVPNTNRRRHRSIVNFQAPNSSFFRGGGRGSIRPRLSSKSHGRAHAAAALGDRRHCTSKLVVVRRLSFSLSPTACLRGL
jgi:hypothetical protein